MIPKSLRQIHLKELSLPECIKGAWNAWRGNFNAIVLVYAVCFIPFNLIGHVLLVSSGSGYGISLIISFLNNIPYVLTTLAVATIVESSLLGEKHNFKTALQVAAKRFVPGFVVMILLNIVIAAGTILLIVPGIFAAVFLGFALQSVVLRHTSGVDALKYSYEVVKGHVAQVFLKILAVIGLIFLIGLVVTPLMILEGHFPSIVSSIVVDVLVSFPSMVLLITYLNLDYLKHGFPGEMPDAPDEVSQPSGADAVLGVPSVTTSLSELQAKVAKSQASEEENTQQSKIPFANTKFFKEFKEKFFSDKNKKILADLHDLQRENPSDMRVKQKIAEVYFKQGRVDEAANTYLEIANHFEGESFFMKAITAYKSILKIKPDLIEINLKLADLYLKLNMPVEASNQYRIAIYFYAAAHNKEKALELAEKLVKIDPSPENKTKLAEIYQINGMKEEAIKQYEMLAKEYRAQKKYDKLLHIYELILPHKPSNKAILKDICILHLRNQNPGRTLQLIDQYNVSNEDAFKELAGKAHMMIEVLKRQKAG